MIVNPAGLYGGGAFRVDTSAATNYFLKQKAKEQAERDALNKYYTEMMGKATSKGMRGQDIDIYNDAIKDMQDYYYQNKDAILGGDPRKQLEFQQKKNIAFDIAESSKAAYNNLKELAPVINDPEKSSRLADQTWGVDRDGNELRDQTTGKLMGLRALGQNVYTRDQATGQIVPNPEFQPFDITQVKFGQKLLNLKELDDYTQNSIQDIKPDVIEKAVPIKNTLYDNVITTTSFSPTALAQMKNTFWNNFDDPQVRETFKRNHPFKTLDPTKIKNFTEANEAYKQVNNGVGIDQEPQEQQDRALYVGLELAKRNKPQIKSTRSVNQDRKDFLDNQQAKELQARAHKFAMAQKAAEGVSQNTAFDAIPDSDLGSGYTISNGKVYKDGKIYNSSTDKFDVQIPISSLPVGIANKYTSEQLGGVDKVYGRVRNGKLEAVYGDGLPVITRFDVSSEKQKSSGLGIPQGGGGTKAAKSKYGF